MKKLIQVLFLLLLSILLAGVVILRAQQPQTSIADPSQPGAADTAAGTADTPSIGSTSDTANTGISVPVVSTPQVPVAATPEPTPTPTPEPTPELFTISVIGDETLTSHQMLSDQSEYSYAGRMNGDYS